MGFLFAFSFVIIQLNFRIDILLLQKLSTLEEVGYYSLGVSIAEKLWQFPFAIGIVLMSRTVNTEDQDAINFTTGTTGKSFFYCRTAGKYRHVFSVTIYCCPPSGEKNSSRVS